MEGSSKRALDSEGDAPKARCPPTGKALTFKALRLQGFLESSGNRHFSFLLVETKGTAGIEVPPEKLQTDEATAATSSFFMPYTANVDDAAGGVEAGIESDDSDDESDDDSDTAEEEDQGELSTVPEHGPRETGATSA